jgi:TetR/AcrR family transcriptional regulator, transcriptional repressor for nem operon
VYLTVQHRETPTTAAPPPPCSSEIGRCTDATKQAYTDGVLVIVDDIATRLAPGDPRSARVKTLSVFAMMVGTLQLSRALADQQLADQVFEECIQNALVLLGAAHQT